LIGQLFQSIEILTDFKTVCLYKGKAHVLTYIENHSKKTL